MSKKIDAPFTIAIDTREQRPLVFPESIKTKRVTLKTGDYSIVNLEDSICIERKSKNDAYSTIGTGRNRFVAELHRMVEMHRAAIVLECTLADFLEPPATSELHPRSAINSLLAWSVRFDIPVFFAGSRRHAAALVYNYLEKFYKYYGPSGEKF